MYWDLAFVNFGHVIVLEFSDAEIVNRPSYMIVYLFWFFARRQGLWDATLIPATRLAEWKIIWNHLMSRKVVVRTRGIFNRLPAIIVLVDENRPCACVSFYHFYEMKCVSFDSFTKIKPFYYVWHSTFFGYLNLYLEYCVSTFCTSVSNWIHSKAIFAIKNENAVKMFFLFYKIDKFKRV